MKPVLQTPDPTLRKVAHLVPEKEIGSKKIKQVILSMMEALRQEPDGVAIAAPQIGESLRIFVISGTVFSQKKKLKHPENDRVFINPIFTNLSKKKKWMDGEGCLSVRWKYGETNRHEKVTVRAYDEKGELFELNASGFLSHIIQHEMDHLNGILFIDHARDIREFNPEDVRVKI